MLRLFAAGNWPVGETQDWRQHGADKITLNTNFLPKEADTLVGAGYLLTLGFFYGILYAIVCMTLPARI